MVICFNPDVGDISCMLTVILKKYFDADFTFLVYSDADLTFLSSDGDSEEKGGGR